MLCTLIQLKRSTVARRTIKGGTSEHCTQHTEPHHHMWNRRAFHATNSSSLYILFSPLNYYPEAYGIRLLRMITIFFPRFRFGEYSSGCC